MEQQDRDVSSALLEVEDLRTHFLTRDGVVRAVDGIDFSVHTGETLGLVGESGCGKSVTALSIMRLVPKRNTRISGRVVFKGTDLVGLNERRMRAIRGRRIAMIYQDPMTSLNPVINIGRQVSEGLRVHMKLDARTAQRRARELLDTVGIPSAELRLRDYPHQFSGGMRQRAMIAMALACDPDLILADEITTALDVTIQAQILELLRTLTSDARTSFVLITHDLGIVAGMTQRVHVMYAGQIVEKATTTELFENPRMPYTWGLLQSLPRLDRREGRLTPIEGVPPDLTAAPPGCQFEPRCAYRRSICRERRPELVQIPGAEPGHQARCWGTQDAPGGGWLIGARWRRGGLTGGQADSHAGHANPDGAPRQEVRDG